MLINFSFSNFRSFKDWSTLNMMALKDDSLKGNRMPVPGNPGKFVLRSATIYGPNASGKSNVMIGMSLLKNFVLQSHYHQRGVKLNHQPFLFDKKSGNSPTTFEISFIKNDILHEYRMSYDKNRIVEESLHHYPRGKKAKIFSRDNNHFLFNTDEREQRTIASMTPDNVLYLSKSVQFNYEGTKPAYDWFHNDLIVIDNPTDPYLTDEVIRMMNRSKGFRKKLLRCLRSADPSIIDAEGELKNVHVKDMYGRYPPQMIGVMTLSGTEQVVERELDFVHSVKESGRETRMKIPEMLESEGTRKLFGIAGPLLDSLEHGKTLVIDEMDSKLHHEICTHVVDMFHDDDHNSKGAQLIINTHNLLLLDQERFRRDQIWFVEKDAEKVSSSIYPLVDFKPRKDRDLLKGYLMGRFGALPYIEESGANE